MDERRMDAEIAVLEKHMPSNMFRFVRSGVDLRLMVAARTNQGNVYTLCMFLRDFPNSVPVVCVTKMLNSKGGKRLDSPDGAMHTLSSENGWTRICHYGSSSWTPRVSLFKVYVKARLWLEMYELHLLTGKPIDYYLNHQA